VVATHSTEIISEVESDAVLNVNKNFRSARRINSTKELQEVFGVLGSNLNPTLTQLAKTRRVVFVEGKDFQLISRFARKLGFVELANRADFALIPVEGFNPQKVRDFAKGMETALGATLTKFVIFDRDYRSEAEVAEVLAALRGFCHFAVIHGRKELENFLLSPRPVERAIRSAIEDRKNRDASQCMLNESVDDILARVTDAQKNRIQSQFVTRRMTYSRRTSPGLDLTTTSEAAMNEFDNRWKVLPERMRLVPGKEVLSSVNGYLQDRYKIHLTTSQIIQAFETGEVDDELRGLLIKLDEFRRKTPLDDVH